ncbi:MAG: hypothetical protein GY810_28545 [Aureispira sp.]|nr:hypothetical protein [Aureispira sp.]
MLKNNISEFRTCIIRNYIEQDDNGFYYYENGGKLTKWDEVEIQVGATLTPTQLAKMGRLYTWSQALKACPSGWHLPTDEDWEHLIKHINKIKGPFEKHNDDWYEVGLFLKSSLGWSYSSDGIKSEDDFGFAALPAGSYGLGYSYFDDLSLSTNFWSATEKSSNTAWQRYLRYDSESISRDNINKQYGLSVRCLKD